MVDSLAKFLRDGKGLELLGVAHDNYPQKSWEIGGKIPDVIARDNARELLTLGEAKTAGDIINDHTREQLTAWSSQGMVDGRSRGTNLPIYLSVPRDHEAEANLGLRQWGLGASVIVLVYG